jgi:hypothetical protein
MQPFRGNTRRGSGTLPRAVVSPASRSRDYLSRLAATTTGSGGGQQRRRLPVVCFGDDGNVRTAQASS